MKKHYLGIFVGALMITGLCAISVSAMTCSDTLVGELGMQPTTSATNVYTVFLDCSEFSSPGYRRFYLHADLGEAGYATLLTAKSLTKNVDVDVQSRNWNSIVTDIMIKE